MKPFFSPAAACLLLICTLLFVTSVPAAQEARVSLIERYRRALAIDAHNPTLQYQLGVALLVEDKPQEAIEKFQRAYPAYTDSVEMNYNLGLAYSKIEDPDSAVLYFEQAEALGALQQPGRYPLEDAYFNLGLIYLNNDLYLEAEQLFTKVLSLNPDRIKVHHALGKLYTLSGQADKAVAEYELYLTNQPNDQPVRDFLVATYYNAGLKNLNENEFALTREDFAKALKISPDNPLVRYTLAHTDMLQGDPSAAIDKLNNISPQDDQELRRNIRVVIFNSALALLQRKGEGDLIKAEQAVRNLLETTPEDANALFLAGNISLTQKHYDQARASYETLLDIDPGHEGALLNLSIARKGAVMELVSKGRSLLQKNEYLAALTAFETALAIDPAVPDAAAFASQARKGLDQKASDLFNQADQALSSGEMAQGLEFARKGLNNQPDNPRGNALEARALSMLHTEIESRLASGNNSLQQGNLEQARLSFTRTLELDAGNNSALAGIKQIDQQYRAAAEVDIKQAEQALAKGELLTAETAYRKALSLQPGQPDVVASLARTQSQIDATVASALRQAERAARAGDFDTALLQQKKALALRQTPEIRQKLVAIDTVLKKQAIQLITNAEKLTKEEKFSSAEKLYTRVLRYEPNHAGARNGLVSLEQARSAAINRSLQKAEIALKSQDTGTALTTYRKILLFDPANQAALTGLQQGKLLAAQNLEKLKATANQAARENRFSDAETGYRKVLELDPYHAEAIAAIERIDKARQRGLQAGDEQLLYLDGIQLYTKGRYQDAIASWQKVLLLIPDHEKAQMNIEKSRRKLRMIEEHKQ